MMMTNGWTEVIWMVEIIFKYSQLSRVSMYKITKHKSYCKMQTDRVDNKEVVRKEKRGTYLYTYGR